MYAEAKPKVRGYPKKTNARIERRMAKTVPAKRATGPITSICGPIINREQAVRIAVSNKTTNRLVSLFTRMLTFHAERQQSPGRD